MSETVDADGIVFTPAALAPRHDGWTIERQRRFIIVLADCGQVTRACAEVGMSVRSAYRLRRHPLGRHFHAAWKKAMRIAVDRLVDLAYERAIEGTPQQMWKNGELVGETRRPSDHLLMFLLRRVDPQHFGPQNAEDAGRDRTLDRARFELDGHLDGLGHVPCDGAGLPLPLRPAPCRRAEEAAARRHARPHALKRARVEP